MKITFLTIFLAFCLLQIHGNSFGQAHAQKDTVFSFAFLTDIHIISNLGNLRDEELPAARESLAEVPLIGYQKLLDEVKGRSVDFIVTGGDNIDLMTYQLPPVDGKLPVSEDTVVARKYIERMKRMEASAGFPFYFTIGNHDTYVYPPAKPDDPLFGQGFFAKYFGLEGQSYYSFDEKGWHFIVLSTFDGNGSQLGVSDRQLDWLKSDISGIDPSTPVILVAHAPFPLMKDGEEISRDIYKILKHHNVRLALFGHWHCFHEFTWNHVPCIIGSSASGAVWSLVRNVHDISLGPIHKGTDQGYLVVRINGTSVTWNHYPFSYSIEKYLYEKTGKRSKVSY